MSMSAMASQRTASSPDQGKEDECVCDSAVEYILTDAHHLVWTAVHETSRRRSWVDKACVGRRKESERARWVRAYEVSPEAKNGLGR